MGAQAGAHDARVDQVGPYRGARDLAPSVNGAKSVLAQLKAINLPVGSDNPADYLDLTFIEKLKADGFVAAMQKQYAK